MNLEELLRIDPQVLKANPPDVRSPASLSIGTDNVDRRARVENRQSREDRIVNHTFANTRTNGIAR